MHTDWLHQVIATHPLTPPRDAVKALLTTDLTLSRTEERVAEPGPSMNRTQQNGKRFGKRDVYGSFSGTTGLTAEVTIASSTKRGNNRNNNYCTAHTRTITSLGCYVQLKSL